MSEISWKTGNPPAVGWYYTFQKNTRLITKAPILCWRWWDGEYFSSCAKENYSIENVIKAANNRMKDKKIKTLWSFEWPNGDHPNKPAVKKVEPFWPDGTPKSLDNAFTLHMEK